MKIITHKIKNKRVQVTTDHQGRNQFNYPANKFESLEEMKLEIERSKEAEDKRKELEDARIEALEAELEVK